MARWSVVNASLLADHGVVLSTGSLVAFLSTLILLSVCVTVLLALCAAHSNPHVLNARREWSSEPVCELAIAPPEEFKKDPSFRISSNRNSAIGSSVLPKLSSASAAINKLSSSFRISSFRDPSSSFRTSSFRISSFRMDSCKQVDGVDHVLRRVRRGGLEEEESAEPAVWQRAILRGERCAPLSFSGLILYDENGNQLPSFREETKQSDLHYNDDHPTMAGAPTPQFGSPSGSELETNSAQEFWDEIWGHKFSPSLARN